MAGLACAALAFAAGAAIAQDSATETQAQDSNIAEETDAAVRVADDPVQTRTSEPGEVEAARSGAAGQGIGEAQVYGPPVPADIEAANRPPLETPAAVPDRLAVAVERAVTTYPSIQAAEATIQASRAEIRAAKWQRFPSVSVEARTFSDRTGNIDANVVVDQPLWTGGRISAGVERAQAERDRAIADLEVRETEIALRTISAYYEIARAARREAILRESLSEHQRLVESMERRVAQQVSPASDLALATSRAAQVEQELALTIAQRYAALQRFAELVGSAAFDPGTVPTYEARLHHPPTEGAVVQAIACNPALRRLSADVAIAEAERKNAEAQIMPQLSAQFSRNEITGNRVGLVLRAQTNGGLSPLAAAQGARLRQQSAEIEIATAQREIRELVILDVVENSSARGRIENSGTAAISSAAVTESFLRQFITGRRTWLDVMNAVRESSSARIGLAEAEISAMASAARLLIRTCRWRPDLTVSQDSLP